MSFLSKHIAQETGTVDPVTGPDSPHHGAQHHEKPLPASDPIHRVIHDGERETPYKYEHYPLMLHKQDGDEATARVVNSDAEMRAAVAAGFRLDKEK